MKYMAQATGASSTSRSVLVVDDDTFSQDFFCEMLSELGFADVHCASNGRAGLSALAELPRPPDFLICDVYMPDMDGIELLDELARREYRGGIVLVSGLDISMMAIAVKLAVANGLKLLGAHSKPVSLATLAATLNRTPVAA